MKTLKLLLQALLEWVILIAVILIVSWVIIQITHETKKTNQGLKGKGNHHSLQPQQHPNPKG